MTDFQSEKDEGRMQTVNIQLPEELARQLDERVNEAGKTDRAHYIRSLIEKDVAKGLTLRDILAPVREQIEASGMTEDELTSLLEESREEVYQGKKAKG